MRRSIKSEEILRGMFLIMLLLGVAVSPIFLQMNRQRRYIVDNFFMAFQDDEPDEAFKLFEPQYQNWYRDNLDVPKPQDWIIQFRPRFLGFLFRNPQWYSGYLLDPEGNVHHFGIEAPRNIFQISNKKITFINISDRGTDISWAEVEKRHRRQRASDFLSPIVWIYLLSRFGSFVRLRIRKPN